MKRYQSKLHILHLGETECHILLRARVAGLPIRCVVDTGASHSCMDAQFVIDNLPEVQVQNKDAMTAGIGAVGFGLQIADIPNFQIGRFHTPVYPNMALIDFTHINAAYKKMRRKPVNMILGNDFFTQYGPVIDYPQLTFSFTVDSDHAC